MSKGVAAAGHPVTVDAAAELLGAGGNAFDAAVGAFFAACVAEPVLASLGGGGFINARCADGRHLVQDFFAQTPRRPRPAGELDFRPVLADFGTTTQEFHVGAGAVATPGAVRGLLDTHAQFGELPLSEVVAPAVAAARGGVEVTPFQAGLFEVVKPIYTADPGGLRLFGSPEQPGRLLRAGERLYAPEQADLFEALAREGPDLFYRGEVARRIVAQQRDGGQLSADDLAAYRSEERMPLEVDYRGHRISLNPPPSSGGVLIAFGLGLLEGQAPPVDTTQRVIQLVRVMGATQKARIDALAESGDGFSEMGLLEPAFLRRYRDQVSGRREALNGTTHISVMDAQGNAAAVTVSNGEGCGRVVPGCGFMLNNMLGEEDLHPRGFHAYEPDQRLTSMMCPTLVFEPDGGLTVLGSGGSNRIRTALLQVLDAVCAHGASLDEAVGASRVHFENGRLSIEGGFDESLATVLQRSFAEHQRWEARNLFFGGVHAVRRHGGGFSGIGDPRRDGAAQVVA